MCTRHLRRRGILTIARRRKRAASGGGRVRGSCPPTEFRSPSSHRASGIVRHGGDQMPSRQLFDSSRFDRDHLTASGRRAAPRATRCSPRNVCFRLAARSFASRSRRSIEGVWPRTRAASSNPSAKLAPHRSSLAVYGRSRHPRAAPTRTKLVTFDRWPFRSDSLRGPRGDMVHRPSGAPSTAPTLPAAVYMLLPTGSLNRADLHTGRERVFALAARFNGLVHLTLVIWAISPD